MIFRSILDNYTKKMSRHEPENLDSILSEYKGLFKNCKLKFEGLKKKTEDCFIRLVEVSWINYISLINILMY